MLLCRSPLSTGSGSGSGNRRSIFPSLPSGFVSVLVPRALVHAYIPWLPTPRDTRVLTPSHHHARAALPHQPVLFLRRTRSRVRRFETVSSFLSCSTFFGENVDTPFSNARRRNSKSPLPKRGGAGSRRSVPSAGYRSRAEQPLNPLQRFGERLRETSLYFESFSLAPRSSETFNRFSADVSSVCDSTVQENRSKEDRRIERRRRAHSPQLTHRDWPKRTLARAPTNPRFADSTVP